MLLSCRPPHDQNLQVVTLRVAVTTQSHALRVGRTNAAAP